MKFPFNFRIFPFRALDPTATGSYPHPPPDENLEWMPEDGLPTGDEPLEPPEESVS